MAINFPDSPSTSDVFTDSTSGFSYEWTGTLWKSFTASSVSNIQILDDISGSFNNSTTTFNLTVGSVTAVPANAQQLEVILGGIQQSPGVDYTISGSTVTFTTAPTSGLTFSGKLLGTALSLNTISADTDGSGLVSLNASELDSGTVPDARFPATLPAASGANLTNLDASDLTSGTVPDARFPATLPAASGANLTSLPAANLSGTAAAINGSAITDLNGSNIASGTVAAARVATLNQNTTGTAGGLTGTPDITVNNITGAAVTFSGDLTINGTLTYEDVTNVDAVGLVTAAKGFRATAGGLVVAGVSTFNDNIRGDGATDIIGINTVGANYFFGGSADITGITTTASFTATSDASFSGFLKESATITAGKLSDNTNIDVSNGNLFLFTTQESTTSTPNIRYDGSTTLNSKMSTGEAISVTIVTTAAAGGYSAQLTIDGSAVTENWVGGSAPDAGGSSGVDIYVHTIIKTGDGAYTVLSALTKTSS